MVSIGLVLGAGGVVGRAYHVGALQAIEDVTGWDARRADLIVGTSAGAGMAAALRSGFSAPDQLARLEGRPLSPDGEAVTTRLAEGPLLLPGGGGFDPLGLLRLTAPWLVLPAFLAPGPVRPGLLAGLLPRGRAATTPIGDRIRALVPEPDAAAEPGDGRGDGRAHGGWPAAPTWVCATRVRDGKRVVFGRDDVEPVDLATAVEASSAVPGLFEPVAIGGHRYLDGGAFSATNADLVAPLGFDLVVVVSPMSIVGAGVVRSLGAAGRALHAHELGREVGRIRESGTRVLALQPTPDDLALLGTDPMSADGLATIAAQARASVTRHLLGDDLASRVELLWSAAHPDAAEGDGMTDAPDRRTDGTDADPDGDGTDDPDGERSDSAGSDPGGSGSGEADPGDAC